MTTVKFQLEPLTCPTCIKKIETGLTRMTGMEEATVMFNSSKVKATFDEKQVTVEDVKETIEKLGYAVMK